MRRKLSAVVLALGLSLSVFSMGVYAEEAATEAPEQIAVETEAEVETEVETEAQTEMSPEEQYKQILSSYASQVSTWTDEQIEQLEAGKDMTSAAIAQNWKTVKNELGAFVEMKDAQMNADGTEISGNAVYEKTGDVNVVVTYSINEDTQAATMNWSVDYPMGTLLQQAALNTVMGIGIVFVVLLFLSFLIGKIHYVTDAIEGKTKKKSVIKSNAGTAAKKVDEMELAAIAGAVAADECMNDYELVAVITAAIAAAENTSTDSFVVRSIKKENRKNWLRAA